MESLLNPQANDTGLHRSHSWPINAPQLSPRSRWHATVGVGQEARVRDRRCGIASEANPDKQRPLKLALEALSYGVLLVTENANVAFANSVGIQQCRDTPALAISDGRLLCCSACDHAKLLKALGDSRRNIRSMIRVCQNGTEPVLLATTPMHLDAVGAQRDIVAMITLGRRQAHNRLGLQFFSQMHALTSAEARVLETVCDGGNSSAVAAHLGVKVSTVRAHIRSILQKTFTHSVREIVTLISAIPPIAGVNSGASNISVT